MSKLYSAQSSEFFISEFMYLFICVSFDSFLCLISFFLNSYIFFKKILEQIYKSAIKTLLCSLHNNHYFWIVCPQVTDCIFTQSLQIQEVLIGCLAFSVLCLDSFFVISISLSSSDRCFWMHFIFPSDHFNLQCLLWENA